MEITAVFLFKLFLSQFTRSVISQLVLCFPFHSDFTFCFYTKSPLKHFVVSQNALLKVGNLSVT